MKAVVKIWWVALLIKTVAAILIPFSNDEAYYWVWGHHPRLSYFDHPPMVGWLFYLGTSLESIGNAARLPGVWLGHLTLLVWLKILEPWIDKEREKFWIVFVMCSPFLGLGSLIVTPDVPLLFFWSLSLLLFQQLLTKQKPSLYVALGITLGLGFCSKYLMVLFVPISFAWLFWSGAWRQIRWAYVPLTIFTGLLFCSPVLIWNWQNEWASFSFQIKHGLDAQKTSLKWPLDYLAGQIGILFPLVAWLAMRKRPLREGQILLFFGWLPIAFFFYTSFKARVEANWPLMAYPALLSLAVLSAQSKKDWIFLKVALGIWITATVVVVSQVLYPWLPIDPKKLKTNEFSKFDSLIPEVQKSSEIYLGSYQMAASVSYKLRRQIYKLGGLNRRDFYDFSPHSYPKSESFAVAVENGHELPAWVLEAGYKAVSSRPIEDKFTIFEVTKRAEDSHL